MTKEEACVDTFLSYIKNDASPTNIVAELSKTYDRNILSAAIVKAYEKHFTILIAKLKENQGGYAQRVRELNEKRIKMVNEAMLALTKIKP